MKLSLVFSLILLNVACVKKTEDPSWIEIKPWILTHNGTNSEGELSYSLKDAYIMIDNKTIGYFELPIKIPILMDGIKKIDIYPVIRNNGISATKKVYPFLETFSLTSSLIKNKTLEISPTTKYKTNVKFWIENFEEASHKLITDPFYPSVLSVGNNQELLKYGSQFGQIKLSKKDSIWMGTTSKLELPKNGAEVYLEIDYIINSDLLSGIIAYDLNNSTEKHPNIQLNKQKSNSKTWKKIYIDLKEIVSKSNNAIYFKNYFYTKISAGQDSSMLYLDNIKVVHF